MKEMINKLTVFLMCLCVALAIGLGVTQHKLLEAQEQNARMEQQLKEMGAQVNAIWVEYIGQMKRIQQHGGQ